MRPQFPRKSKAASAALWCSPARPTPLRAIINSPTYQVSRNSFGSLTMFAAIPTFALGQKQTSAHDWIMSALPPKADIVGRHGDVRFVPKADIMRCSNRLPHHMETCRAQVAASRCVTRPANEEKSHGDKHRFLSVRCDRGCNHLYRRPLSLGRLHWRLRDTGVPAGTEPHSRAYLSAKGIRDIASGLFAAMLIAFGSAHALGWFMLIASIFPLSDAVIVRFIAGSLVFSLWTV
jgi:Domain of unknown function (DUF4267)